MLKGIETGDPASVAEVNEEKYIQYDPQTQEGSEGLAALFKRLSMTNPRVNLVRVFADGDYVFAHTEYDFATRRIGFEVFRFEDDLAVEHWDIPSTTSRRAESVLRYSGLRTISLSNTGTISNNDVAPTPLGAPWSMGRPRRRTWI